MNTERFSWTALGATEEEAQYALNSGFLRHLQQVGMEWAEADQPTDWYEARVREVHQGQCFMDEWEV